MPAVIPQFVPDAPVIELNRLGQPFPNERAQGPVDRDETKARVDTSRPGVDVFRTTGTPHPGQRAQDRFPLRRDPVSGGPQPAEPSLKPGFRRGSAPRHVGALLAVRHRRSCK